MAIPLSDRHLTDWVAKIETRLEANPHDAEAWFALGRDAQTRPVDQMREFWERAVAHFPTHPYFWMLYIEQEIRAQHFEEADKLFSKCLNKIPSIELSRQHVRYVMHTHPPINAQNREKIRLAYDQAMGRVGFDIEAGPLYLDYIRFLKECEASGAYAEQERGLKIREVYQKAVAVPLNNIEHMWKDYCHFENEFQQAYADKITAEKSREYMNAKKNSKILEPIVRALRRDKIPSPPRTLHEERRQIENWRKWINFERSNPLLLDEAKVMRRGAYVFENCLMCMPYRIDIWLETAAHYREAADKALARNEQITAREVLDAAGLCLERGIVIYSERALFYLIIADLEEFRKNFERVKKLYDRCLLKITENPTLVYIHYMLFVRRSEGLQAARQLFIRAAKDPRITQEIYVVSALMEYFAAKEKQGKEQALRIFERGFKRYPVNGAFMRAYVEFMVMQNEPINAKILMEKAYSAESLSLHEKLIIAGRSLEFDTLYGDFDSIQKTEKSRTELLSQLQIPSSTSIIASGLVSRWNYLNLTPLTENDLKNMDYIECRDPASLTPCTPFDLFKHGQTDEKPDTKSGVTLPDLFAMIPFKPRRNNRGFLRVSGGDYAFPEALEQLKRQLPPPESFAGPFPDLDQVIRLILEENSKSALELQNATDGVDAGMRTIAQIMELTEDAEAEKIKLDFDPDRRSATDIYRTRQAKKMKLEGE